MKPNGSDVLDQRAFWNNWHRKERQDTQRAHRAFLQRFLSLVPDGPPHRILELGCGQGDDAAFISRHGFEVVGLDISYAAVERARRQTAELSSVSFTVADIASPLPFDDASLTAAYAYLSLHYFDEGTTTRVFNEIRRVLRPGGLLGFVVKSVQDRLYGQGMSLGADYFNLDGHVRHFFSVDFTRRLTAGWGQVSMAEYKGLYIGGPETDSFISVLARRPAR